MDMDGFPIRQHRSLWRTILAGMATGALVLVAAGCGGQSAAPGASSASGQGATSASGSASSGQTPLAQAVTYSQCMRSHGVPNFPDPVPTPSGGYGYRTAGIDPNSAAFQEALQACKALPSPWNSTSQQLCLSEVHTLLFAEASPWQSLASFCSSADSVLWAMVSWDVSELSEA